MIQIAYRRIAAALVVALLASVGTALADQHESAESGADNVLLTVRIGRLDAGKRTESKTYELVVVSGGAGSNLLSGSRVPFPTTTGGDDGDDGSRGEITYVYQNVGFTVEAHAWVRPDGRIKIAANLEDSFVQASAMEQPPSVETRQLSFQVLLEPGKPLEVTRVEGPDRAGFVEVEARVVE